jgi:hypothetical protein
MLGKNKNQGELMNLQELGKDQLRKSATPKRKINSENLQHPKKRSTQKICNTQS